MGKKSGPPPPDYTQLAQQTAQSQNQQLLQQTYANRPSQVDAFGNRTDWTATPTYDAASGNWTTGWTQTQTLSPQLQQAYNSQVAMQQGRSDIANSLMGSVAQQMQNGPVNFDQFTPLAQGAQAGNVQATTNPYGFGPAQGQMQMGVGQQDINTGLS